MQKLYTTGAQNDNHADLIMMVAKLAGADVSEQVCSEQEAAGKLKAGQSLPALETEEGLICSTPAILGWVSDDHAAMGKNPFE